MGFSTPLNEIFKPYRFLFKDQTLENSYHKFRLLFKTNIFLILIIILVYSDFIIRLCLYLYHKINDIQDTEKTWSESPMLPFLLGIVICPLALLTRIYLVKKRRWINILVCTIICLFFYIYYLFYLYMYIYIYRLVLYNTLILCMCLEITNYNVLTMLYNIFGSTYQISIIFVLNKGSVCPIEEHIEFIYYSLTNILFILFIYFILIRTVKFMYFNYKQSVRTQKSWKKTLDNIKVGTVILNKDEVIFFNREATKLFGFETRISSTSICRKSNSFKIDKEKKALIDIQEKEINKQLLKNLYDLGIVTIDLNSHCLITPNLCKTIKLEGKETQRIETKIDKIFLDDRDMQILLLQDISHIEKLKEGEAENKFKTMLISTVTHELRNPTNAILNMLEILEELIPLSQDTKKYLTIAQTSGKMLLFLINDILDFAKIERGTLQLTKKTTKFADTITETIDMMRFQVEMKNLKLRCSQTYGIPEFISIDEGRIKQIFLNIISNSIKFTQKGGVYIHIYVDKKPVGDLEARESSEIAIEMVDEEIEIGNRTNMAQLAASAVSNLAESVHIDTHKQLIIKEESLDTDPHSIKFQHKFESMPDEYRDILPDGLSTPNNLPQQKYIFVSTRDTGMGIKAEDIDKLFKPFVMLEDTEKQNTSGTGLGLYICKCIIELMGGGIKCESEWGEGTTFTVWIPIEEPLDRVNFMDEIPLEIEDNSYNENVTNNAKNTKNMKTTKNMHSLGDLKNKIGHMDFSSNSSQFNRPSHHLAKLAPDISQTFKSNSATTSTTQFTSPAFPSFSAMVNMKRNSNLVPGEHREPVYSPFASLRCLKQGKCSVLVADDNIFNYISMQGILKLIGFQSISANNGEKAIEILLEDYERKSILFILMDIEMPILGGLEATKRIKELILGGRIRDLPIFGLTGHEAVEVKEECLAVGMKDCYTKPLGKDKLTQIITRINL